MASVEHRRVIRAGVFETVEAARRAIERLRNAGFQRREISVVCSEPQEAPELKAYIDQRPAGPRSAGRALTRAGFVYGVLALLGVAAAALTAVFVGLLTAFIVLGISLGIALLSVLGSIMVNRGSERELADFHAHNLGPGQLLVAVDLEEDAAPQKISAADEVLRSEAPATVTLPHESPAGPTSDSV